MCTSQNGELQFGATTDGMIPGLDVSRMSNTGRQFGLQPGLSYEQWLHASGLTDDGTNLGARAGFRAYRALTGNPLVDEGEEAPPAAVPGAPQFSLRIDRENTGGGDLRIGR